jgi:putrescine importer
VKEATSRDGKLGTPGLVIFGLVLVQPIAVVPVFGIVEQQTDGHASLALLLAMFAMLPTAFSYGRMAATHAVGGSAYTYASRELHPTVGFLAGWAMGLDYVFIPILSALFAALTLARVVSIPLPIAVLVFVGGLTAINLKGRRVTFRVNVVLLVLMLFVVAVFVSLAIRYLLVAPPAFPVAISPLRLPSLWHGTAVVALTYLGFDGVSTLTDDARDPRKGIPRAVMLVVLMTGGLGILELGLAQAVLPDTRDALSIETAFLDAAARVGGATLRDDFGATLVLAAAGTFLSAQSGAARLLLAMGRDRALPSWPFGAVRAGSGLPHLNLLLVSILTLGGTALFSFEGAAEMVNFGAFTAFLAVNAANLARVWRIGRWTGRLALEAMVSFAGFAFCLLLALGLSPAAALTGVVWLALGGVVARRKRTTIPEVSFESPSAPSRLPASLPASGVPDPKG